MTSIDADDEAVVRGACSRVRLDYTDASALHRHATHVWLLPHAQVVVRISRASGDRERAARAVAVTRWLVNDGFPAAEPVAEPVEIGDASVTFWRHYSQQGRDAPGAAALGSLLHGLHALPDPPVVLDSYVPLVRLGEALESDAPLAADDRAWLADRRLELLTAYRETESVLGVGLIHGDAYPGNLLRDGNTVRLGDWDEVAHGPRELDLVNTHQGARIGRSPTERDAFTQAYGWDVTAWSGYATLREMRDVHTLGAYIGRAATGDTDAAVELEHRIRTLRSGDTDARWHTA